MRSTDPFFLNALSRAGGLIDDLASQGAQIPSLLHWFLYFPSLRTRALVKSSHKKVHRSPQTVTYSGAQRWFLFLMQTFPCLLICFPRPSQAVAIFRNLQVMSSWFYTHCQTIYPRGYILFVHLHLSLGGSERLWTWQKRTGTQWLESIFMNALIRASCPYRWLSGVKGCADSFFPPMVSYLRFMDPTPERYCCVVSACF